VLLTRNNRASRHLAAVVGLLCLGWAEARADYTDLLATNVNNGTVTDDNRTTGAFLGVFATSHLVSPRGIAIGSDHNVYVSDISTQTIDEFNGTTGAFVKTFAPLPNDPVPFYGHGMAFGPNGDLFVSSFTTNAVLEYNGSTGAFVRSISGGSLAGPTGLAFGPDGNLYVADSTHSTILEYNGTTGAFIKTFATGNGLNQPSGLTFAPDGTLFVANFSANDILRFNLSGTLLNTITNPNLSGPSSVVFDGVGGMFVSDVTNVSDILRFNADFTNNKFSFDKVFVTAGLNAPIYLALAPVPEPTAFVLFGLGVVGLAGAAARTMRRDRA
jgi:WD40 repeat protein